MHVRGSFEAKATWSYTGYLDTNPYEVNLWFEDSQGHKYPNTVVTTGANQLTQACIPYSNLGSRHHDTLYAKVNLKIRIYYFTPNENAPATRHTELRDMGTKSITIGQLEQFYVKIINQTQNTWARAYENGTIEIPYEKFSIIEEE